ncbi:MAG: AraC family transcriptional regulator [Oscillospiraceae bacterium]|nr:AraC family transcriptional regulator [Oscillospiraceae bacterium]
MNEIETSPSEYIQAAELSGVAFVSRTSRNREFYSVTGHTAAEYARRRRLSNALAMIKASDLPLADIAYECGFSSQQAMNRAVRARLNMTPLEYKNSDEYYYFPSAEPFPVPAGTLNHTSARPAGGVGGEISVKSEIIPASFCAKYYSSKPIGIEDAAVGELFRQFPDYSGRVFGRDGKQRGARFCYELYLTESAPGLACFEPGGDRPEFTARFATTAAANSEEQINGAWDALCNIWLPSSMFERSDSPYFEEYVLKNGAVAKLKLYLPIQKRLDAPRFRIVENPGLRFAVADASGAGAEKRASQAVMDFLTERYPRAAQSAREFYVRRSGASYTCGARLDTQHIESPRQVAGLAGDRAVSVQMLSSSIRTLEVNAGRYLVLESGVMGDYELYSELLDKFARENGFALDPESAFALYDASGGFDSPRMKVFRKINTGAKLSAS